MLQVCDRFGDHGLVGAAAIVGGEIVALVMSCRVLGLGVEHKFVQHMLRNVPAASAPVTARVIETARNMPVRNLYRDNGFTKDASGLWHAQEFVNAAA